MNAQQKYHDRLRREHTAARKVAQNARLLWICVRKDETVPLNIDRLASGYFQDTTRCTSSPESDIRWLESLATELGLLIQEHASRPRD